MKKYSVSKKQLLSEMARCAIQDRNALLDSLKGEHSWLYKGCETHEDIAGKMENKSDADWYLETVQEINDFEAFVENNNL